jgi:hypothetical protein
MNRKLSSLFSAAHKAPGHPPPADIIKNAGNPVRSNFTDWLRPSGIRAKLNNVVASLVPVGYEDETGFHYGVKAAPVPFVPAFHSKSSQFAGVGSKPIWTAVGRELWWGGSSRSARL